MITPDNAADGAANDMISKSAGDQCVPLKALAVDGTNPSVGDEVEFTVKGRVTGIDGDNAQIKCESVNGEPVSESMMEKPGDEDDAAMKVAEEADSKSSGY